MRARPKQRGRNEGAVSVFEFYRLYGTSIRQRQVGEPVTDLEDILGASLPVWQGQYLHRPGDLRAHAPIFCRWCLRWGSEVPAWVRLALRPAELLGLQHFAEDVFKVSVPEWLTHALEGAPAEVHAN